VKKKQEAGRTMSVVKIQSHTDRASGILMHITSLPSLGGVGDFGPAAYAFADFLAAAKQRMWQVLPLAPTGFGHSPYAALSAFAGNPLLISIEQLVEQGWLGQEELQQLAGPQEKADFETATRVKLPLISKAANAFLDGADAAAQEKFKTFREQSKFWLEDYVTYNVLQREHNGAGWHQWPRPLAIREPAALRAWKKKNARALDVESAVQFFFQQQWQALRSYCAKLDIRMLGDVAIFVNYDSADVWRYPEIFDLDKNLLPVRVSGVPPDYFSETGQRWGNPLYRWDVLEKRGFDWWVERVRRSLELYDEVRLDHFRGFEAYWSIPADEPTAVNGKWVKAPGAELFTRLHEVFGRLPFVAEDLGLITPEVDALREQFSLPCMRVLQFGFGDRGSHIHLPHRFTPGTVAYTGTHDNDTILGWWRGGAGYEEKNALQTYLQPIQNEGEVVWAMVRAAARSVAKLCIIPMQDLLWLGTEARMNVPSMAEGNWLWRMNPSGPHPDVTRQMAHLMEITDRDGVEAQ
jgi:4-alpha-glucanotransferase